jgi:hypothetical protein
MKVNLNNTIMAVLTKQGLSVFEISPYALESHLVDREQRLIKMDLKEFILIFGNYMTNGYVNLLEYNIFNLLRFNKFSDYGHVINGIQEKIEELNDYADSERRLEEIEPEDPELLEARITQLKEAAAKLEEAIKILSVKIK